MPTHVALLRGINVGRANRIAMADLRAVVADLGHAEVATYLQSGNVVFSPAHEKDPSALATELSDSIERRLAVSCHVVVLTASQWRSVVAANPYPTQAAADPTTVHAAVQQDEFTSAEREALTRLLHEATAAGSPDHLTLAGRATYLWTPGGLGRSTLAERLTRAKGPGKDRTTARNWRTVEAPARLLDG